MDYKELKTLFTPPRCPWLFEVRHQYINENDIYVFGDRLIHRVYLVWHMIERPGHWRVLSNKGDNLTLPEDIDKLW